MAGTRLQSAPSGTRTASDRLHVYVVIKCTLLPIRSIDDKNVAGGIVEDIARNGGACSLNMTR